METSRLKHSDIKKYRERLLKQQRYKCPLCQQELLPEDAVLDHDHETGHVRRVLHRSCNQAEGRILSWAKRSRSDNPKQFVKNLVNYWALNFTNKPLHPSHLSPTEKKLRVLRRRMKKLKSEKAKQRLREEIRVLQSRL